MENAKLNRLSKKILIGFFMILISLSFSSCAKNYTFMVSPIVPAARGKVKVSRDHNKNYVIDVQLYNLAEVERLENSKLTYIVWLVSDQQTVTNIGQLKSSTAMFSKQLKASLKTVSSTKPEKIIITAENDPGVQSPGSQFVMSTNDF